MKFFSLNFLFILTAIFLATFKSLAQSSTPIITLQPQNQSITEGQTAIFSLTATCPDSIGYQWWRVPFVSEQESKIANIPGKIEGATTNLLKILNINLDDDSTQYLCEVYNKLDHQNAWVNTNTVILRVKYQIPIIILQPENQYATEGQTAIFSLTATCPDSIGYQWWRVPFVSEQESKIANIPGKIEGATTNLLKILNINLDDDSTQYLCEVYNKLDHQNAWVNSNTIMLRVNYNKIITITTNPAGLSIIVDDTTYTSPKSFNWTTGAQHQINTTSPQGNSNTRYIWSNWSDGGAITHTITVSDIASTYTANFNTEHYLTISSNPSGGGIVTPQSGWHIANEKIQIEATNNSGYYFTGWIGSGLGSYTGTNNPDSITMQNPISEIANFSPNNGITITTNPVGLSIVVDDTTYTSPKTFSWTPGPQHQINTISPQGNSNTRYIWTSWSDGEDTTHTITAPNIAATYTANFNAEHYLTISSNPTDGGVVTPQGAWHIANEKIQIEAVNNNGYYFTGWTGSGLGSYTGTNNPDSITIQSPISEIANFNLDSSFAIIELSASSINFGYCLINSTSQINFNIINNPSASGDLNITDIESSNNVFTITPINFNIHPGDTQEVIITFSPKQAASYNATLSIYCNAAGNPNKISLNGIAFNYPANININKSITFGGIDSSSNYQLVGLPGLVNSSVRQFISGEQRIDWNAYWDNGSDNNYQIQYDGTSIFNFTPGKALWMLSKNPVNISILVNSVTLAANYTYSIPLHNGWNLISNPFGTSVNWNEIQTLNNLKQNQILYEWNDGWSKSPPLIMEPYKGYYFNNLDSLSSLIIPYNLNSSASKMSKTNSIIDENKYLKLSLIYKNEVKSAVFIGINRNSNQGFDEYDYLAAPGDFENFKISLVNNNLPLRYRNLFIEQRPNIGEGQEFNLTIKLLPNQKSKVKC